MNGRLDPFDAVFGAIAPERFPVVQRGLEEAGRDPHDRDQFVLVREVVELLRELAPLDAMGEGVRELVGFAHASYLYWLDGLRRVEVDRDTLDRLLGTGAAEVRRPGPTRFALLPARRVWGTPIEGSPAEPLDGLFLIPGGRQRTGAGGGTLAVVGVFGLHPGRAGLTVVEAAGPPTPLLQREDGSTLFSPRLAGGKEAGLYQILGEAELVELGYRLLSVG